MSGLALGAALLLVSACGDSATRAPIATCVATWQILASYPPGLYPSVIAQQNGMLYYSAGDLAKPEVLALSTEGGSPTAIGAARPSNMWVEGDHLVISEAMRFSSLPLAGGEVTVLADFERPLASGESQISYSQALTPTDFIWTTLDYAVGDARTSVWRAPRAGGDAIALGETNGPLLDVAVGDGVVVGAGSGEGAQAFPLDGSGARALGDVGVTTLLGVEGTGAYWSAINGSPQSRSRGILLSPVDGGLVQPFWRSMPAEFAADRIWAVGDGTFLVVGTQRFDDDLDHRSFYMVDGVDNGSNARLVACDPAAANLDSPYVFDRPAFADGAIYVVRVLVHEGGSWQIARIPR